MPAPTTWELALNLFLVGHWIQSWMRRFPGVDPADQTMADALAPAVELLAGNVRAPRRPPRVGRGSVGGRTREIVRALDVDGRGPAAESGGTRQQRRASTETGRTQRKELGMDGRTPSGPTRPRRWRARRIVGAVAVGVAVLAVAAVINDPASPHLGFGQMEAAAAITPGTDDAWQGITREPVKIPMDGGWSSQGELTYPSGATGPLPTVVLLHGSGKNDRDQTLAPDVATLATVARTANHAGYAVLRFDKRGVVGVGPVLSEDPAQLYPDRPYEQILRDAAAAVRFAQDSEHVDADRLFLLGHSEGTQVASNLAADPRGYGIAEPAGVIAMGVVGAGPREVLYYQVVGRQLEQFHEELDADHDGSLTAGEVTDGLRGRPEDVAGPVRAALLDGDRVNGQVDVDGDGRLGIDSEIEQAVRAATGFDRYPHLPGAPQGLDTYLEDIARFPNVVEDLPHYAGPVLLLNGQSDIQTPARYAEAADAALGAAGHRDHTLITYPGMSHLMNLTDKFSPVLGNPDPAVLADITRWLGEHS